MEAGRRDTGLEGREVIFGIEEIEERGAGAVLPVLEAGEGGEGEGDAAEEGEHGGALLQAEAGFAAGGGHDASQQTAQEVQLGEGAAGRDAIEQAAFPGGEELAIELRRGGGEGEGEGGVGEHARNGTEQMFWSQGGKCPNCQEKE